MKKRLCFVGGVYLSYVLFFLLAKVLFLLFHLKEFPLRFGDALAVLAHGLPLDLPLRAILRPFRCWSPLSERGSGDLFVRFFPSTFG